MATKDVDVATIRIQLNELKSKFDRGIMLGEEFASIKKTYMEIKELECFLNVLEWEADRNRIYGYFTRPHYPLL